MQTRKHYFSVKLQLPAFVIKMWDKEKSSNSTMHCALLLSKVSSQILVIYRTGTIFREISSQLEESVLKKKLQFFREINFTKIYHSYVYATVHTPPLIYRNEFLLLFVPLAHHDIGP